MNRRYVYARRIAALSIALSLSACQQNSAPPAKQTTVATQSSSNRSPSSTIEKKKGDLASDGAAEPKHIGQGRIIELDPPTLETDATASVPLTTDADIAVSEVKEPEPSYASESSSAPSNTIASESSSEAVATVDVSAPSPTTEDTNAIATPSIPERVKPALGNVATDAELNQKIAVDWPAPQVVLYVSGQQQGYIEPCGCTGLDSQKGGLIRRDTVLTSLRERGWEVVPVDVGNQNRQKRSSGPQPQIKFETTAKAMQMMNYQAVSLGVHDLELSRVELINFAATGVGSDRPFISGNVVVYDPDFFPKFKIVEAGGRKIGITSVIGKEFEKDVKKDPNDDEVAFSDPIESLKTIVPNLKSQGCDFVVLLAHATLEESAVLGAAVEGIDLVVTAGGYGEPTLRAEPIKDSKAVMVQVGTKGMYGGIVGLFNDPATPIRYQKIAISSQFKDSQRMLKQFAEYQDRLKDAGFSGLGLTPALHPTGRTYVGSETCGECHTQAYDVWKDSPHFHATDSIVAANNDRGGIERHYDPECVSCHVTGWNPQQFSPYQSGYLSLEASPKLLGSGCENCHGPGSAHVDAENGVITASAEELKELQQEMVLPLAKAEAKCMECHDFDNSPDFHAPGAFEKYWEQVKHYGKD